MSSNYFGPGFSDPNDQTFPGQQDLFNDPPPQFTDSTDVFGNPNLPSHDPYPGFPDYSNPTQQTFPNQQDFGGGGGIPQWLKDLLGGGGSSPNGTGGNNRSALAALLPFLLHLFSGTKAQTPADLQRQQQLNQLNQLMIDKAARQAPVHQAAMTRALQLTPSGAPNPRMSEAITAAQAPRETAQTDPHVLAAIRLMMGAP